MMLRRFVFSLSVLFSCLNSQSSIDLAHVSAAEQRTNAKIAAIPVEITSDNFILIKAKINGSDPCTFILDSAAGSGLVLNYDRAQALGLALKDKGRGGGSGEGSFETTSVKGVTLSFPGTELTNQTVVVFPSEKIPSIGRAVDGVIGYKLFSHYAVEIDYEAQFVSLYEPQNYQYSGSGQSIPLTILSNLPFVMAKITAPGHPSVEGGFLVDTGAGKFSVILNTPFVESNHLLTDTQKTIREPGAQGVGGDVKLLVGRLRNLQIGRFTLADPVAHFSQDRKGSLASSEFNGVIGGEVWRRFKIIFDYAHKRMILEPNSRLSKGFDYDMSGIRLRGEGIDFKTFKVQRVVENSPATEAGLREGDVISSIDGKPVVEFSLSEINRMFKQEGKEYVLDIIRGGGKQQIKLKLRRLI